MVMNGPSNSSQCTWINAWPFSVFTLARNFRRISLKSVGLTVLRSTVVFLFSHHYLNFFTPHSVALLVFFACTLCPISSSCSLLRSFDYKKVANLGPL